MEKLEKLLSIVNSDMLMDMAQQVNFWDNSLEHLQYLDTDNLNDYLDGFSPIEIVNKVYYGDFNPNSSYFKFNGYGNLESYTDWEVEQDLEDYKEEIVERFICLYEQGHIDSCYQEICDILDKEEVESSY